MVPKVVIHIYKKELAIFYTGCVRQTGLHITLLGMGCYRLLKRLGAPVRVAAAGGAMTLLLYGMMVGMSVSASRAIGMYLLQMLGIFVGRTYDMLTGVGLLAALLVLQQPERLGDVSFLMSFGAVLGICLLTPVFAGDGREDICRCGSVDRCGGRR
ncbi:MAG: ComEC/Rec2 family competence protein [Waltera sp.]